MNLPFNKKSSFILGSFLLALTLIALFMFRFSEYSELPNQKNPESIVETIDPFVTQRLTERDSLPDDLPLITILDPSRGPENAPVVIVEFSDFECPFCKDSQEIINMIVEKYPNSVRHVWKDAPSTSLHKNAFDAHLAARCAQEQNKFWEYHDLLFENQANLSNKTTLPSIANLVSMNGRLFEQCFDSQNAKAKIDRSIVEAEVLGVNTIPFFFINEQRISGKLTFEQIDQLIQKELQ